MLNARYFSWVLLGLFAVMIALFTQALLFVVIINLAILTLVGALQLYALYLSKKKDHQPPIAADDKDDKKAKPFITIHLPCCNEPPAIVAQTLRNLAALDWDNYEVICLDNNTKDPKLWRPLQELCEQLGPKFIFHHVDRLEGAKAGALDLALSLSCPNAELVAVVDADYFVSKDFLNIAWENFKNDKDIAFVQFPQAYRNTAPGEGLSAEYAHYFNLFFSAAQKANAILLTGTMLVIRLDALNSVGGWRASTITEDAELGAKLNIAGYRGQYVSMVVGRGVMPTDLGSLRNQRRRWVYGNADTLLGLKLRDWFKLGVGRGLSIFTQLTAWFNFILIPLLSLAVLSFLSLDDGVYRLAATFAGASIVIHLGLQFSLLAIAKDDIEHSPLRLSFMAHLGLAWESATAWLERLFGVRLGFIRTDKFNLSSSLKDTIFAFVGAILMIFSASILLLNGLWLASAGAMGGVVIFFSVFELQRQLQLIHRHSQTIITATQELE